MCYDSQEISKVSPNLSLRLSPERRYAPKIITCVTCHDYPCRCCNVCHYLPCRCCNVCHYLPCRCCNICHCLPCRCCNICHYNPCRCIIRCPPLRCCSPCRPPVVCRSFSPCPKMNKMNSPNIRSINSPSRTRNQNINYNAYEERQFNDLLCKLMRYEGQIECAKIKLALNPDFNCEDAFRIFECNGRGFLDANDLKCGLNLIGLCPTDHEVRLLLKRFDLQNEGSLNYADFFDMLVPFEKDYRTMVENRLPRSCCTSRCPSVFCYSTLCALRNVFNLIIDCECDINNGRKLYGTLRLKLRDIFGLLDYLRRGYFTNSDLIVYLQNRGLLCSKKDADLLFIRLDKFRNGQVDFRNVEDELQTLY